MAAINAAGNQAIQPIWTKISARGVGDIGDDDDSTSNEKRQLNLSGLSLSDIVGLIARRLYH